MAKGQGVFTSAQLAKMFNCSVGSIKNWSNDGTIPAPERTPGKHRRFTQAHVDALGAIFQRKAAAAPAPTESPAAAQPDVAAEGAGGTQ
jgi:phage terminase Nu1 subunit (DNA packaging protein)